MRVCICQTRPNADISEAIAKMENIIENISADLYVFPELYLTNYLLRDEVFKLALSLEDKEVREVVDLSRRAGAAVILGFPERNKNYVYNSALVAVVGDVKVYRKIHLPNFGPFEERLYFKDGDSPLIFQHGDFKIGVEICYDIFFPELSKLLALNGADIIVNISASPSTSKELFEILIPARALETTTYFIYCNWVGRQRNLMFWGGSRVVRPNGSILVKGRYWEEDIILGEISLDEVYDFRRVRPILRDSKVRWS